MAAISWMHACTRSASSRVIIWHLGENSLLAIFSYTKQFAKVRCSLCNFLDARLYTVSFFSGHHLALRRKLSACYLLLYEAIFQSEMLPMQFLGCTLVHGQLLLGSSSGT